MTEVALCYKYQSLNCLVQSAGVSDAKLVNSFCFGCCSSGHWPVADAKLVKLTIDLVTRDSNGPSKSSSWMYGPSCNSSDREVIPCPSFDDTQKIRGENVRSLRFEREIARPHVSRS